VLRPYRQHHGDFWPTLATEKLAEQQWISNRVTGGDFRGRVRSDFFDHRLDVTSAATNNAPSTACPIPAPHNNKSPRLNPAEAREGPRPRAHCPICLVQQRVISPSPPL
jgi:hypothetical protein